MVNLDELIKSGQPEEEVDEDREQLKRVMKEVAEHLTFLEMIKKMVSSLGAFKHVV